MGITELFLYITWDFQVGFLIGHHLAEVDVNSVH